MPTAIESRTKKSTEDEIPISPANGNGKRGGFEFCDSATCQRERAIGGAGLYGSRNSEPPVFPFSFSLGAVAANVLQDQGCSSLCLGGLLCFLLSVSILTYPRHAPAHAHPPALEWYRVGSDKLRTPLLPACCCNIHPEADGTRYQSRA